MKISEFDFVEWVPLALQHMSGATFSSKTFNGLVYMNGKHFTALQNKTAQLSSTLLSLKKTTKRINKDNINRIEKQNCPAVFNSFVPQKTPMINNKDSNNSIAKQKTAQLS